MSQSLPVRYQPIHLARALQEFLFDDGADGVTMRGENDPGQTHNLVQAGIISLAGSTDPASDIFYSVWLGEESQLREDEMVFKFEGASDAPLDHLKTLTVRAGDAHFHAPMESISPRQIRAIFRVPAHLVVLSHKRMVVTPFELNTAS